MEETKLNKLSNEETTELQKDIQQVIEKHLKGKKYLFILSFVSDYKLNEKGNTFETASQFVRVGNITPEDKFGIIDGVMKSLKIAVESIFR